MSTAKDATLQSDITKMKRQPDGSFNRAPSSFRNTIEQGGKFAPETGISSPAEYLFKRKLTFVIDRYHLYVSLACREFLDYLQISDLNLI